MKREERRLWIALTALAIALAFGLGYLSMYVQKPPITATQRLHGLVTTEVSSRPVVEAPPPEAMGRLGKALRKHPGINPEQVIAAVNASAPAGAAKPCPFQWRNHDAELVLHEDAEGRFSIESTISTCAESIDHTPQY